MRCIYLIAGELGVKGEEDILLATLMPITTVGEMGMFNRHLRSAAVEALKQSEVLVIERRPFEMMLHADRAMCVRVYHNIVEILSGRIVNDNVRVRDYVLERERSEKERRRLSKKLDVAVKLLAEKAGLTVEEAEAFLDESVEDEKRILIVDDEPAMRKLVKNSLAAYEVSEACNGEEALIAIREDQPNLVIADIHMPKMDGFALADQLKEEFPQLPILALSGSVDSEEIEGYNFVGFVEKPMHLEHFQELIEGALNQKD